MKSPRGSMRSNASLKPRANSLNCNGGIAGSFGKSVSFSSRVSHPVVVISPKDKIFRCARESVFVQRGEPAYSPNMVMHTSPQILLLLPITLTARPPSSSFCFLPPSISAPLAAFTDDLPDEDEEGTGVGGMGGSGADPSDMEAGGGGDGGGDGDGGGHSGNLLKEHGGSQLKGSQQNLYPDINVIPPSRSRSPSASESRTGDEKQDDFCPMSKDL